MGYCPCCDLEVTGRHDKSLPTSMFVGADDIDSNVQGAEAATEQANRQLAKAAKSQKSGTTLVII